MHFQSPMTTELYLNSDCYDIAQDSSVQFCSSPQNNLLVYSDIPLIPNNVSISEPVNIASLSDNNIKDNTVVTTVNLSSSPLVDVDEFLKFDKLFKDLLHSQIQREQTHSLPLDIRVNEENGGYTYNVGPENNPLNNIPSANTEITTSNNQEPRISSFPISASMSAINNDISNAPVIGHQNEIQSSDLKIGTISPNQFYPHLQQQPMISQITDPQEPSHLLNQQQETPNETLAPQLPFLILPHSNLTTPTIPHGFQQYTIFQGANSGSDSIITPTRATFNDEYQSLKSPLPEFTNSSRSSFSSMEYSGLHNGMSAEDMHNESGRRISLDLNLCRQSFDQTHSTLVSPPSSATQSHFGHKLFTFSAYDLSSMDNSDPTSNDEYSDETSVNNNDEINVIDPFDKVELNHSSSLSSTNTHLQNTRFFVKPEDESLDMKNALMPKQQLFSPSSSSSVTSISVGHHGHYQCTSCFKRFTRKSNLMKHVEIVHFKRPKLICPYCKQSKCARKSDLQRHIKTKHHEEITNNLKKKGESATTATKKV